MEYRLTKWRVEDIDFKRADVNSIKDSSTFFYLVTIASFIEITSELYTKNLTSKYSSTSEELAEWLDRVWEFEEMQHGRVLRDYVKYVWSEFDWDEAYKGFFEEYSKLCTKEILKTSVSLEMVERAVVETGTSTLYAFMMEASPDKLLKEIANDIKNDEVSHYKVFKESFEKFNQKERLGKWEIFKTVIERIKEMESDDTYIAYKNIFKIAEDREFKDEYFQEYSNSLNSLMDRHYPYKMAVNMVVQLFDLSPYAKKLTIPLMIYMARKFLFK